MNDEELEVTGYPPVVYRTLQEGLLTAQVLKEFGEFIRLHFS